MPEVEEGPGRAHGAKGPCRHYVNLGKRPLFPQFGNDCGHLFGGHHPRIAIPDPLIDQIDGLLHTMVYFYENIYR